MTDFLMAVKSVRKESTTPEPTLVEVSTQANRQSEERAKPREVKTGLAVSNGTDSANTSVEALHVLKSEPSTGSLLQVLRQLRDGFPKDEGFSIQAPGPLQAQIINSLVVSIIPNFWSVLQPSDRSLLVDCLTNVAGSNAIVARLRFLADQKNVGQVLGDLLSVANALFKGNEFAHRIWSTLPHTPPDSNSTPSDVKRQLAWKELVGLLASGKAIATVAGAEDALKEGGIPVKTSTWLASGTETATWLGRNVAYFLIQTEDGSDAISGPTAASQLLARSFSLGYSVALAKGFWVDFVSFAAGSGHAERVLGNFLGLLQTHTRRQLLEGTLLWLSGLIGVESVAQRESPPDKKEISALTALNCMLLAAHDSLQQHLIEFLSDPPLSSSVTFSVRRASVTALAKTAPDELQTLLERLMNSFGDQLFINHGPILQQESVAQTLLLTAGYLHPRTPMAVFITARSSGHMQGVSNRLSSTNSKARWLGMVVGTAISSLVDKEGSKMDFGTDEMQTSEATWYLGMVIVDDAAGTLSDLEQLLKSTDKASQLSKRRPAKKKTEKLPILNGKQTFGPPRPPQPVQTEVIGEKVSEILDDEDEEEDDDLKPYAKPDSDPEDSDEDATLVNRNKARPPVYIRDLMRMLKDDNDHDRFQMAVKHAPALIRKKSNFGREVKDHAEELALVLCNLQDPFETEGFDELKLQGLIAVLLSDVQSMAPWLSGQAFAGDYGLGQRCIMLSALGLGGRELAGFKDQDDLNPVLPASTTSFPSKRLPSRLHAIYSPKDSSVKRLEAASKDIQHQLIKPLALSAADESTAHLNAVKVRTFSSRMDVERTKRKPAPNQLAKVFPECFFFPLVSRYQQDIAAYGMGSVFSSAPFVLVTFLKMLALLLHASGPATMGLAEISTAFWDLLLSLHIQAAGDISVLEAVLFGFLTLLEVNGNQWEVLARENAGQLNQTQDWVDMVFERTGGGELVVEGSDDEARVRTLAAGVLVRLREVMEAQRKTLMGGLQR